MIEQLYPRLEINAAHLKENIETVVRKCAARGVSVTGVVKGMTGDIECCRLYVDSGCTMIGTSRLDQLEAIREDGIDLPTMLIRIPMLSHADEVVRLADYSLNSEVRVLEALNKAALRRGKSHKVILMSDLGDLREGFWDKEELVRVAVCVEREMPGLELAGVGTNLGCYGSIQATPDKLAELVATAEAVEEMIGRRLEIISGGATSTYLRILDGNISERINHLRIGELILNARDLEFFYGADLSDMHKDVFTLKAEIIEVKDKPTYLQGEIGVDAFGRTQEYTDRGIRRRAIAAIGKVDYSDFDDLFPKDKGIEIIGASSDHTILDIEDAEREIRVGDILDFGIDYASLVFLSNCRDVRHVIV